MSNTLDAIDALLGDPERFKAAYELRDGTYVHRSLHAPADALFDPMHELNERLRS